MDPIGDLLSESVKITRTEDDGPSASLLYFLELQSLQG
jgi:hypothetical protein